MTLPWTPVVPPCHEEFRQLLQNTIDEKTKPLGSLGRLEEIALQIGLIQGRLDPELSHPHLLVFAADHGIAASGASPYPQSVTSAMVRNFLNGGAAINVFAKLFGWRLEIIDAGILEPIEHPLLRSLSIARGTRNMLLEAAMSSEQRDLALTRARDLVDELASRSCRVLGLGEMGIGNSSSAALILHQLCQRPIQELVSRGAGSNDEHLSHKTALLEACVAQLGASDDPLEILRLYGGFELAMIVGASLRAAEHGMIILVDGLMVSAAVAIALRIEPKIKPYLLFAHQSAAKGHEACLQDLGVKPLLHLDMRLGEGTGAALALPIVQAACAFLREMASFAHASIEGPSE